MLDLIFMMLNSLLIGLVVQAAIAGRDHRIAPSIDRVPTNSKAKADQAQCHRPLRMGLAIPIVAGLAFRADHGQA